MPRKSIPSTTLLAQVRSYFGLEQQELGRYLGISRPYVADIEAGRRVLTAKVLLQLSPLAALLPTKEAVQPATLTPGELPPALPAPGPLEARLDVCRHQAAKLRRELQKLAAAQAQARRWQRVLPDFINSHRNGPGSRRNCPRPAVAASPAAARPRHPARPRRSGSLPFAPPAR